MFSFLNDNVDDWCVVICTVCTLSARWGWGGGVSPMTLYICRYLYIA